MSSTPLYVFIDSNTVIQYKSLHEIPWTEITERDHCVVLAAAPMIAELDRLKRQSGRVGKRADAFIIELFRRREENDFGLSVGSEFHTTKFRPSRAYMEDLGLMYEEFDDKIIASIQHYIHENPDHDVVFCTHDFGVSETALAHGIATIRLPIEMRLAEQKTEDEKKYAEVQKQLAVANQRFAVVSLTSSTGKSFVELNKKAIPDYKKYMELKQGRVFRDHGRLSEYDMNPALPNPLTPQDVNIYNAQVDQYISLCKPLWEEEYSFEFKDSLTHSLKLAVVVGKVVTADELIVTITLPKNMTFTRPEMWSRPKLQYPNAPHRPRYAGDHDSRYNPHPNRGAPYGFQPVYQIKELPQINDPVTIKENQVVFDIGTGLPETVNPTPEVLFRFTDPVSTGNFDFNFVIHGRGLAEAVRGQMGVVFR